MRLLAQFGYKDKHAHAWWAQKGDVIDGASIPKAFWSRIGGPYEGRYRNASVVHDMACVRRDQPWKATHRMFYEACLRGGVGSTKAKILYAAVYHFGPRWKDNSGPEKPISCADPLRNHSIGAAEIEPSTYFTTLDDYLRLKEHVQKHPGITLEEIERLTANELRSLVPQLPQNCATLNEEMPDE